ncbi:alpha/beta hydrolase [Salinibacterium sp. SYSU T00001]|uniref:alpha/beta hydrolase n=1 Tax=Homoserinimonas sedimenticola TaxID=2986805 RepID=UPI00223670E2|nr:alpha/beta hydrolase [Salinibacterium sedimenticola]MCW4385681.1 alpha/beta hydrolase [Salinibacterium sedimenticola]
MSEQQPPEEWQSDGGGQAPNADAAFERDDSDAAVERSAALLAASVLAPERPRAAEVTEDAKLMGIPAPAAPLETESPDERAIAFTQQLGLGWPTRDTRASREVEAALWQRFRESHDPDALLALLTVSLSSESELQRVAAAAALAGLPGEAGEAAARILDDGCRASDSLTARVARAAAGRADDEVRVSAPAAVSVAGGDTSIAVHGTWARLTEERWHEPGSPLYAHLTAEAAPELYQGDNYFRWASGYDARSRAEGTDDLVQWLETHDVGLLDTVFAHSHGGSVALSTAARGQRIRVLVLMHTPALPRPEEEWARIRRRIGRTLVMRTRLDLVVLADALRNGSGQRFDQDELPHREITLHWRRREGWFDHDFFLEPETWMRFDLANEVRYERSLAAVPQPG